MQQVASVNRLMQYFTLARAVCSCPMVTPRIEATRMPGRDFFHTINPLMQLRLLGRPCVVRNYDVVYFPFIYGEFLKPSEHFGRITTTKSAICSILRQCTASVIICSS